LSWEAWMIMPFPDSACTLQLSVFRAECRTRHIISSRLNRQQLFEHWSRKGFRMRTRLSDRRMEDLPSTQRLMSKAALHLP